MSSLLRITLVVVPALLLAVLRMPSTDGTADGTRPPPNTKTEAQANNREAAASVHPLPSDRGPVCIFVSGPQEQPTERPIDAHSNTAAASMSGSDAADVEPAGSDDPADAARLAAVLFEEPADSADTTRPPDREQNAAADEAAGDDPLSETEDQNLRDALTKIAIGRLKADPEAPWVEQQSAFKQHYAAFSSALHQAEGASGGTWAEAHQIRRQRYESMLSADELALLPGRGTPTSAPQESTWTLQWDSNHSSRRYETVIYATAAADGASTPVEVVTYNRDTGDEQARYRATAFVDSDGTVEIDATGQNVSSESWGGCWSPDSFSLLPDGELHTIDDKFDGSTGSWLPSGDS